jgi:hypothetical protein
MGITPEMGPNGKLVRILKRIKTNLKCFGSFTLGKYLNFTV